MSNTIKDKEAFEKELYTYVGVSAAAPEVARDEVNEAMIRRWCDVIEDENPAYTDEQAAKQSVHGGLVAPPTMLQAWVLPGIEMVEWGVGEPKTTQQKLHKFLTDHGFSGVVATNCDQSFERYLKVGDRITGHTIIESISEEKATALGVGYFIVTRTRFVDQNENEVGSMSFRVLKFKPAQATTQAAEDSAPAPTTPTRLKPPMGHDNGWWWNGINEDKLLIQRCSECQTLRHPPRPMCGECRSTKWDSVESSGRGTVYSYTVMHHPKIPGYEYPLPVALINLEDGTRIVSNIIDCAVDDVHIGMPVQLIIQESDPSLKLPFFRPAK